MADNDARSPSTFGTAHAVFSVFRRIDSALAAFASFRKRRSALLDIRKLAPYYLRDIGLTTSDRDSAHTLLSSVETAEWLAQK